MKAKLSRLPLESNYAETYLIHLAENKPDLLRSLMLNKEELVNIVTQQWRRAWELRKSLEESNANEFVIAEYVNAFLAPPDEISYDDVDIVEPDELRNLIEELINIQRMHYQNH